jgi:hypothetical protein
VKKESIILNKSCVFAIVLVFILMAVGCDSFRTKLPLLNTKNYSILAETHNHEAGFFSLCEGHNGKIYVGTEFSGENAFLVEFDPVTEKQRIVIDVNEVCDSGGSGITAQSKIHTINYVAPSGIIYVGSKQGGPNKGQNKFWYPGGYIMTYNPKTDKAKCLGQVPIPGHGIIDVTADEERGLIYIVTCDDGNSIDQDRQLWMVFDMKTKEFRVLGPHLCRYGTTLVAEDGRAFALTHNFDLAVYEPDIDRVSVWPTYIGEKKFDPINDPGENLPTWVGADNNKTAFFMMLCDPMLYEIDIASPEPKVSVVARGKMIDTNQFTASLAALRIGPDGKVYNLIKDNMETGIYHLVRYDRKNDKIKDLGIVNIKMGKRKGDLRNQGMTICRDGTIYATFIYPFELHRFENVKAIDSN